MAEDDTENPDADLDERVATARKAAWDAMGDVHVTGFQLGYRRGHRAGFDAGVEWIMAKLKERAEQAAPPQPDLALALENYRLPAPDELQTARAADVVTGLIAAQPGARGVELVAAAGLHERTVRTALHRLKKAKTIRNIGGRWYLPKDAPAGADDDGDDDATT